MGQIRAERPDLLILDYALPDMEMRDFVRELKSELQNRAIPVILLTRKPLEGDLFYGGWNGIAAHITKPFNPMELIAFVKRTLRDWPADERSDVWEERFPV